MQGKYKVSVHSARKLRINSLGKPPEKVVEFGTQLQNNGGGGLTDNICGPG